MIAVSDSFYDAIGGHPTLVTIVDRFYSGVAADEVLGPLYASSVRREAGLPDDGDWRTVDLAPARERLTMFLAQYWGGPTTYSATRGHPRLRMRHASFPVDEDARARWLGHFRAGLDEARLPDELDAQFWAYVTHAAQFLVNRLDTGVVRS